MSTPPNPPSTHDGPPTEPEGTPVPETAPIPAPAQPLSLDKNPAAAPAPETPAAPAATEATEATETPESSKSPTVAETPATPAAPEAPAASVTAEAPEAPEAPATPETPTPPETPAAPAAAETPAAPAVPAPAPGPSPFAPPTPAPATAYLGEAAAPGAPGNPWAQPGPGNPWTRPDPGFDGSPYAGYPQAPSTTNGLAVAALIVAGFAILFGIMPFLFWAGALLALIATGLGIAALRRAGNGAPNRTMAVVGTVLGVVGLGASVGGFFLTASVLDEAGKDKAEAAISEERHELGGPYPSREPWPSASPSPTQVPGLTSALPFGETFTYPNGVKVSLSAPKKYEPKGIIAREQVKNAIQITITITNGSSAPHEVIYAVPNVRDDQGMTADLVFDSGGSGGGVPKMVKGSILPGESASGIVAFELPEGTRSITADIAAGTLLDDVKYAGPLG